MLNGNIGPDLGWPTERSPVPCDLVRLSLQNALIRQPRTRINVHANELGLNCSRDRKGSHAIVSEDIDSERQRKSRLDLEGKRAQKRNRNARVHPNGRTVRRRNSRS